MPEALDFMGGLTIKPSWRLWARCSRIAA